MATVKSPSIERGFAAFLQAVVVLVGLGAAAFLLWQPQVEGVNAHATQFEIYFKDPFLAYVYVGSVPFFVALYQAFKVLGLAGRNQVFSPAAVRALRTIRYCAVAVVGFVAGAEIIILSHRSEDHAGPVVLGAVVAVGSVVVAAAAAMFERVLRGAVDIKSENDLTV